MLTVPSCGGAAIGALLGSRGPEIGGTKGAAMLGGLIGAAGLGLLIGYGADKSSGEPILLYQSTE